MFDRSGFAASAGLRLGGALAFALLAFTSVAVIEGSGDPPAITASAASAPLTSGRLVIEATFPVARWTVQVQGKDVIPTSSTPQRYEAELSGELATIFLQADPADATSTAAGALRWRFAGQSGMLWGEGTVADTIHATAPTGRSR
jgi:hypothetical protein